MNTLKIMVRKARPGTALIEMHPWWVFVPDYPRSPILMGYNTWREAWDRAVRESLKVTW